jgi:Protein of unknown function (DUF2809)
MIRLVAALMVTVGLGALSRLHPIGWSVYDKSLGDALYAGAVYLTFAIFLIRKPITLVATLALAVCLAIESFQATGIPARYAHFGVVRWLLGTTFSWHDVACYVVGVVATTGLDYLFLRPGQEKK